MTLSAPMRAFVDTVAAMAGLAGLSFFEVHRQGPARREGATGADAELVLVRHGEVLQGPQEPALQVIIQAAEATRKGAGSDDLTLSRIRWTDRDFAIAVHTEDPAKLLGLERVMAWVDRELPRTLDHEREAAALEALGDGLLVIGADGCITHCTRRAAELIGTRSEALEGRLLTDVLPAVPRRLEPNEVSRGALGDEHPDIGYLVQELAPNAQGVEREGLIVKLRHERRFASQRNGYLRFLSALRHDVRSPLTALKGLVSVLMDEPDMPTSERMGLLVLLKQEADRTVTWVEDYLLILRLRFEPRPTHVVAIPLETMLTDLVRRFEEHALERRIRLSLAWPSTMVGKTVQMDAGLLEPFGNNLLGHMLRLGDAGAEVEVMARDDGGALIIVGRGPGLFASHPKEPFTTLARSTASGKRTPGVGLGLFIVKKIADVHGWQVAAEVVVREGEPTELRIAVEWS